MTNASPPSRPERRASLDRQAVQAWIERNPGAQARFSTVVDSDTGQEILVVNIPDRTEMDRAKQELLQVVRHPEHLRVRRWRPPQDEVDRIMRWALDTLLPLDGSSTPVTSAGPDPESGLVMITLRRADAAYAADLEARTDGLAFVSVEPDVPEAPIGPPKPST
ncbi:hypothetical protein GCM10009804_58420 [Kribbella hippodromi]|uniref:Uncharacterized protein n=1 Tax=Kribbella hippodromi TaxID=434347 RepID=A0ABN2E2D1_9ACTN